MDITYSGGPIVHCPLVYTSFWGPAWSDAAHTTLAGQLNQFHQDLLVSRFMNVLTQYGLYGGGAFVRSLVLPGISGTLTVPGYEAIIQDCINVGAIPEPQDPATSASVNVLIIYLDENTIINGGGRELNFPGAPDSGYHDSFTTTAGHKFIYAFVSYSPDHNVSTVVASHEFAEMITDPYYNAWTPDGGYTEIGDLCEGDNATLSVSGRSWQVQTIWSDTDNACISEAASPIPAIAGGPGGDARFRPPRRLASYERLLPLPALYLDLKARKMEMKPNEVGPYARKLFSPVRTEDLFPDFPAFLRQTADVIGKVKEPAQTREKGVVAKTTAA